MKIFLIQHENRFYPETPQTVRLMATNEYNALATFKATYNTLNDRLVTRMKEIKKVQKKSK
mgnify:CR=1 FL=1